ncbi:MAG: iron ABC transporter permease [Candidatus Delongbacteria bacterium]|nr:iron ABC transporter permease [Candidatus Delongbacteria bacterium]MDD4205381.1 iron ABC transporter permease [Candidatus Delongbacteria bacterium]
MRKFSNKFILLILLFLAFMFINIIAGPDLFSPSGNSDSSIIRDIIFRIRLPRALTAAIAGGTFAICGAVFQSLFRNPIASPFTLGTAGGASFGVTVFISFFSITSFLGTFLTSFAAFLGALLSVAIVYFASSGRRSFNPNSMILTGVVINFFFSGLILLVQYLTDQASVVRITRWTMGSIDLISFNALLFISAVFIAGLILLYYFRNDLNLLSISDEISVSRGVDIAGTRKKLFIISSVMISSVVSVTGPIGFIGIIAPHIASFFFGKNYRRLLPASVLTGSIILLICDAISRTVLYPAELPVGIISAIAGAVFFSVVLTK